MGNWYVLRVKVAMADGLPKQVYYEAVEWLDNDEPLRTNIDLDNGDDVFIEAGTFEIVESGLTEAQVDRFLATIDKLAQN